MTGKSTNYQFEPTELTENVLTVLVASHCVLLNTAVEMLAGIAKVLWEFSAEIGGCGCCGSPFISVMNRQIEEVNISAAAAKCKVRVAKNVQGEEHRLTITISRDGAVIISG